MDEISDNDKLLVALAYFFTPLAPIIIMLMADKDRPFIKAHNVQALVLGVVLFLFDSIIGTITCGLGLLVSIGLRIYLAYKGYQGEYINIPVITDLVKGQGWA